MSNSVGLDTRSRVIDGVNYTVTQHPARAAIKLLTRVTRVMGPMGAALAPVLAGLQGAAGIGDLDVDALGASLARACAGLKEEEVDGLIDALLEHATYDHEGKRVEVLRAFNTLFRGNVVSSFKLMAFSLEVNFADFSAAIGAVRRSSAPAPVVATASSSS